MADDDLPDPLLATLREALDATDPPPRPLVDAAKASLAWRTVDSELAELVADSSTDPAVAVRAAEPPRVLTFAVGDTLVVVEVTREPDARHLIGQLVAPSEAAIEVRHAGGVLEVESDADGRFRAGPLAVGPMSLRCRFADAARAAVVTSWVSV